MFNIETGDWKQLDNIIASGDVVINCAGAIPQQNCNIRKYIVVNTLFPHKLNEISEKYNKKLIHITTDCVFSGKDGNYDENSRHDAEDIYGISKSLGENESMCIIRTSIIGEELKNKRSLIEWVKSQQNKTIDGYENVFWNGVSCLQLAKIIGNIIVENSYWKGVRHIASPNIVSKSELCKYINEIYNLNITICNKQIGEKRMNLASIYPCEKIPDIKEQIYEQAAFIPSLV
jgi:dTDP-4-dehydrorhamnose reductase